MQPPPSPAPAPRRTSGLPPWALWAGAALALALVLFLVGLFVGRGPGGELRDRAGTAETRATAVEGRAHAFEALSLLYRTAIDLEARNFGVANDRLEAAAAALGRADGAALGAELGDLRQRIAATSLVVADDLDSQRTTVLGFARELNEALERAPAAPGGAPTAAPM
jgi:hypothetical protein